MNKMQKCCFQKNISYYNNNNFSHQAKESWEMDLNEKLDLVSGVKTKGNQYFKV